MIDLAGGKSSDLIPAQAPPLPGVSLAPAFQKNGSLRRESLYFHHLKNKAIRVGDWKLVSAAEGPWELYDVSKDRSELRNLAAAQPAKVEELANLWQRQEDTLIRQRESATPMSKANRM